MRTTPMQVLRQANAPAFLVSNLLNIRYLTGLSASSALLLVTGRSFALYLDPRYTEMGAATEGGAVRVRDIAGLQADMERHTVCGFEEEDVSVARLRRWKALFTNTKLIRTGPVIEEFRRRKDADERTYLWRALRITEELLRRVPSALRRGITERALAWKLELW